MVVPIVTGVLPAAVCPPREQLLQIMNQRPEIKNPVGSMAGPPKKKAKIASKPPPEGQRSVFFILQEEVREIKQVEQRAYYYE